MSFLRGARATGGGRSGTPAPANDDRRRGGCDESEHKNIPAWDGRVSTLKTFAEDVELWCAGAVDRMLPLMSPREARAHEVGTKQRSVAMALRTQTLRKADGPQLTIKAFKESLSYRAEGELWSRDQNYVFGGQRTRGMTMAEYLVQEGVLHDEVVKGLWTISAKSSTTRTKSAPSGSQATAADAAGNDDEDDEDITTVFPEVVRVSLRLDSTSKLPWSHLR